MSKNDCKNCSKEDCPKRDGEIKIDEIPKRKNSGFGSTKDILIGAFV